MGIRFANALQVPTFAVLMPHVAKNRPRKKVPPSFAIVPIVNRTQIFFFLSGLKREGNSHPSRILSSKMRTYRQAESKPVLCLHYLLTDGNN